MKYKKILVIGNSPRGKPSPPSEMLTYWALKAKGYHADYVEVLPQKVREINSKYDVVFIFNSVWKNMWLKDELNRFKKKESKIVMWSFDYCSEGERLLKTQEVLKGIDLFVHTDGSRDWKNDVKEDLHLNQGVPSHWKKLYPKAMSEEQKKFDVIFTGRFMPHRFELLNKISSKYKCLTCGFSSKERFKYPKNIVSIRSVYEAQFLRAYNSAKLSLIPRFSKSANNYWSNRMYTALSTGIPALVEEIPGLEDEFDTDKDFILFNEDNLMEKIEFYLSNYDKALQIGKSARKRVWSSYRYEDRVEAIMRKLGD